MFGMSMQEKADKAKSLDELIVLAKSAGKDLADGDNKTTKEVVSRVQKDGDVIIESAFKKEFIKSVEDAVRLSNAFNFIISSNNVIIKFAEDGLLSDFKSALTLRDAVILRGKNGEDAYLAICRAACCLIEVTDQTPVSDLLGIAPFVYDVSGDGSGSKDMEDKVISSVLTQGIAFDDVVKIIEALSLPSAVNRMIAAYAGARDISLKQAETLYCLIHKFRVAYKEASEIVLKKARPFMVISDSRMELADLMSMAHLLVLFDDLGHEEFGKAIVAKAVPMIADVKDAAQLAHFLPTESAQCDVINGFISLHGIKSADEAKMLFMAVQDPRKTAFELLGELPSGATIMEVTRKGIREIRIG